MNQIDLRQRIAIVTGGGSGKGYASAERFLRSGATVELWRRDHAKLADAQARLAPLGAVTVQAVDVSRWERVEAAANDVLNRLGRVDILFNCAGVSLQVCPTFQVPLADWHAHIAANLDSTFYCSRVFGPGMVERGFGRTINTSSMAGKDGTLLQAAYSAAKGGVIAFTKSLAKELATSGVTVNAIAPTLFDTPRAQSVMTGSPGLNLLTGYAGVVSLGHGALVALGGYTTTLLMVDAKLSFWLAAPAGMGWPRPPGW